MAAFFGIEEGDTRCSIGKDVMCLPLSLSGRSDFHYVVSPIKNEDIVFLKHCTPQSSLQIKAVGPVISGGTTYLFTLTLPMQFSKPQTFKDDGGVYGIDFELTPIADPTAGFAMQAQIVNQTAAFAA